MRQRCDGAIKRKHACAARRYENAPRGRRKRVRRRWRYRGAFTQCLSEQSRAKCTRANTRAARCPRQPRRRRLREADARAARAYARRRQRSTTPRPAARYATPFAAAMPEARYVDLRAARARSTRQPKRKRVIQRQDGAAEEASKTMKANAAAGSTASAARSRSIRVAEQHGVASPHARRRHACLIRRLPSTGALALHAMTGDDAPPSHAR